MSAQIVDDHLAKVLERLGALKERAHDPATFDSDMTVEILTELSVAFEELRVAQRKLEDKTVETDGLLQRYQQLFEFAPDAYVETDGNGYIRQANRAAHIFFNLPGDNLARRPLAFYIVPEQRHRFRTLLFHMQKQDEILDLDLDFQPRERAPIPGAVSILAFREPSGRTGGLLWLIRDISGRRRAYELITHALAQEENSRLLLATTRETIAQSQARYHGAGEAIPLGVWTLDREGNLLRVSNAFLERVGLTLDECKKLGWKGILARDNGPEVVESWEKSFAGSKVWESEFQVRNRLGTLFCIRSRGIPLIGKDTQGTRGWVGRSYDLTEIKQEKEALRLSQASFQAALNQVPIIFWQEDRESNLLWAYNPIPNAAGQVNPDKIDPDLLSPEQAVQLAHMKRQVLESGTAMQTEMKIARPDGTHWYNVNIEPQHTSTGEVGGLAFALLDISEQKRRQERLEEVNAELDRMVATRTRELQSVNNQLRTLAQKITSTQEEERRRVSRELHDESGQALTALKMNLESMREMVPENLPDLRKGMDEAISLTAETMVELRTLAQDLRPPSIDTVELGALLEGLCHEFTRRSGIPVHYSRDDLPPLERAVSITLYRVLQEALTNVTRHANASHVRVLLQMDAEGITLTIEDNGIGFEYSDEVDELSIYTGIGIIGMKERLNTIGGHLEIHSAPGEGTRVVAYVPVREAE